MLALDGSDEASVVAVPVVPDGNADACVGLGQSVLPRAMPARSR